MSRCPLYAVAVVDASLPSLSIAIEVLEIIIEVDRTGAEVPPKKRGVSRKDCCYIYPSLLRQRQRDSGQPFVEMGNDSLFLFMGDELVWR